MKTRFLPIFLAICLALPGGDLFAEENQINQSGKSDMGVFPPKSTDETDSLEEQKAKDDAMAAQVKAEIGKAVESLEKVTTPKSQICADCEDQKEKLYPGIDAACQFLADKQRFPKGDLMMKNCTALFKQIPNRKALEWTLRFFSENVGGIENPECMENGSLLAVREEQKQFNVTMENVQKRGIENLCEIQFNDFSNLCNGKNFRKGKNIVGRFIDLCADKPKGVVRSFQVNAGSTTCARGFSDTVDANATAAGPYVTIGGLSNFTPDSARSRRNYAATIPAKLRKKVMVAGLMDSNDQTAYDKHTHISPYNSSWGCPSFAKENFDILQKLGAKRTLLVNYGPEKFHKDPSDCKNISAQQEASEFKQFKRIRLDKRKKSSGKKVKQQQKSKKKAVKKKAQKKTRKKKR